MRVDFHPAAWKEVEHAQVWYEERSLFAASAFLRELSSAVQRIREAPSRYLRAEAGTRRILLDRFPFSVYYRVNPEGDDRCGGSSEAPARVLVVAIAR